MPFIHDGTDRNRGAPQIHRVAAGNDPTIEWGWYSPHLFITGHMLHRACYGSLIYLGSR